MVKHRYDRPAADLDGEPIPDGASATERRHAAWGLAVLAMIAILIVTIMAFLIGPTGGHPQRIGLDFPTGSTQPTPTDQSTAAPTGSPTSSAHTTAHPSTSAKPSPSSTHPTSSAATTPSPSSTHPTTPHSSTPPSQNGIPLEGDGDLIAWINDYRTQQHHNFALVTGGYSPALSQCTAQAKAPGSFCTPDGTEGVVSAFNGYDALKLLLQQTPQANFFTSRNALTCSVGWSKHTGWSQPYYFAVICTP